MFHLDDCLAFVTFQSAKIFSEALDKDLKPYNITRSQWIALYYIYQNENITQRELADKMSVKQPTVVRLLQDMESLGYLRRSGSTEDKRVKQLELTAKGTQVCLDLLPVVEKFKDDTITGISEQDLQKLRDTLDAMIKNALKTNR